MTSARAAHDPPALLSPAKNWGGWCLWYAGQSLLAVLLSAGLTASAPQATERSTGEAAGDRILTHTNRSAAGTLADGVLTLHLEVRQGRWYPESEPGPSLSVQAFAEENGPAEIPGPLIRVPRGTEIHVTVRNWLATPAEVYGLHARPGNAGEPLEIPPGEIREARFRVDAPGTYYYWGSTTGKPLEERWGIDSQLSGALIVDPPGQVPDDRVFVIGLWADEGVPGDPNRPEQEILTINGKSWPYSEKLTYTAGDTVRWRWLNPSVSAHPMHLHGFYFQVDSVGDADRDEIYPEEKRRRVVTERMEVGSTMSLTWVPEREGRWLFHCHILAHMVPGRRLYDPSYAPEPGAHDHSDDAAGMAGLVMGINVLPAPAAAAETTTTAKRRELRLLVRERPATASAPAGFAFQFQEGPEEPPLEAATVPGPALVLTRGEPVAIEVINELRQPTSVHWHGLELDSYYDGVAGWTGLPTQVTPPVEPGRSFMARFTPPRAGTFIYHTHWHDVLQLTNGLYGPLIVLESGETFDPETDKILLLSIGGPDYLKDPILLNGNAQPQPLHLKAGVKYRLRFINITANNAGLRVSLLAGAAPALWRPVAKDGANLAPAQAVAREAKQVVSVGETYDFEFVPKEKGKLRLEVLRPATGSLVVEQVLVE